MECDVTHCLYRTILVTARESNLTAFYSYPERIHHAVNASVTPSEMKALLAMDAEECNSTPSTRAALGWRVTLTEKAAALPPSVPELAWSLRAELPSSCMTTFPSTSMDWSLAKLNTLMGTRVETTCLMEDTIVFPVIWGLEMMLFTMTGRLGTPTCLRV